MTVTARFCQPFCMASQAQGRQQRWIRGVQTVIAQRMNACLMIVPQPKSNSMQLGKQLSKQQGPQVEMAAAGEGGGGRLSKSIARDASSACEMTQGSSRKLYCLA
jgi:hypothetical protein